MTSPVVRNVDNPNPQLISDPMWELWRRCPIPGVELSGFYANKKGYHNTVNNNKKHWPDNYSIKLSFDLPNKNRDFARAIDLTMGTEQMKLWTSRMKASAENPVDHRLAAVREFYGTLDGKTVFGLQKDNITGPWRRVNSDDSHLWHGHTSIFTAFVDDVNYLAPLVSVWAGEINLGGGTEVGLPSKGSSGEEVVYWQYVHNVVRGLFNPPLPELDVDGDYGSATAAAFAEFGKRGAGLSTYNGNSLLGWVALKYQTLFIQSNITKVSVDPEAVKAAVADYFNNHQLQVTGSVKIS